MQQQYNYNYVQIPMNELPSQGMMYPDDTIIKGRFMSIQDVKYLSLINEDTAPRIVNEIIDRCFYMTIPLNDLLLCDREYLALWLRANTFMKDGGYRFNVNCHNCKYQFTHDVKLDDIPINYLEAPLGCVMLPKTKEMIQLKLPSIKDLDIKYDDFTIERIARMITPTEEHPDPLAYILNLNAYDYAFLSDRCGRIKVGFDFDFVLPCPHCGKLNNMSVISTDDGLFNAMNIRDIINVILRVTKYVGCFIPDSTPWPELEMIQDVTNAMIKEENEEMQKQEAKSRAQAASMQSKYASGHYRGK